MRSLTDTLTAISCTATAAMGLWVGINPTWASWGTTATWGAISAGIFGSRIAYNNLHTSRENARRNADIEYRRRALQTFAEYYAFLSEIDAEAQAIEDDLVAAGFLSEANPRLGLGQHTYRDLRSASLPRLATRISDLQRSYSRRSPAFRMLLAANAHNTSLVEYIESAEDELQNFTNKARELHSAVIKTQRQPVARWRRPLSRGISLLENALHEIRAGNFPLNGDAWNSPNR